MLISWLRLIVDSIFRPSASDSLKSQAIRQVVSGAAATAADLIVFKIGLILSIPVPCTALISGFSGAVINFLITRHYVFGHIDKQKKGVWTQFAMYIPAVLVSMGLTQLILLVFHLWLNFDPMLVRIAAIPVVYVWTVLCGKYIIFNRRKVS
ncbi:MAG: GtrA family protein [Deltaproteobacteria bacterium]|jgi:putative flippase GtrA|nr:GtrA family protein [Deltaproteobacteria bacterium]